MTPFNTKHAVSTMDRTEKMKILRDFDRAHKDGIAKDDPDYYAQQRAFYEEFLDHPERFQPTDQAILNVYQRAFEKWGERLEIPKKTRIELAKQKIASGDLGRVDNYSTHWTAAAR